MAGVDLYGNDAGAIRNAYKTKLRRDASDDEVSGWLSGSYGGGGLNDWVNQIGQSGEAQQYNPPAQQPQAPQAPVIGQNPNVSRPQDAPAPGGSDPWAQARQGLESVYQQYLGRGSNGDADKWLSGGFGHGSGLQDYDKYVSAIMGSHEARNYRGPGGTQPQGSLEWWQQQGTPTVDIFDPTTGQLRNGWSRTGQGYQRTGGTGAPNQPTGNVPGPQGGNFQSWFQQLTQGKPITPQTLVQLEPVLNQYGIKLGPKNARGFTDGIILPDGTFVDVIIDATETGGSGWGWITGGHGGGGGQAFGGGVGGGVNLPGAQYSDPHTKLLEELLLSRINGLQQGTDPGYQQLMSFLQQRFGDLQTPGYTGAENEVIRTQALDPVERDRTAAKKRMTEQLAARGLTLDSGIAQQALLEVDKAFDGMRASNQNQLAMNDIQRREGRQQQAQGIATTMYDIPQGRNREAIGYAGSLSDLGPQRMQLAMQAAGMGGSPQSMFSSLMQMAQLNQNSALLNQQNSGQLWSGLGSLAYTLMNSGK